MSEENIFAAWPDHELLRQARRFTALPAVDESGRQIRPENYPALMAEVERRELEL